MNIQENYREYTDRYFLRSRRILEADGINPVVRYQVFARKGGLVRGVAEAVDFIKGVAGERVRVLALSDGATYSPGEPLMKIEGRAQDLVEMETVYLGIISGGLTGRVDLEEVRRRASDIVRAAEGKPVIYFGARHFHYSLDEEIGRICLSEGFAGASTDAGARSGKLGSLGTMPHDLIIMYAAHLHERGSDRNPTVEAARAFERVIEKEARRIVLCDTFSREITDTIATVDAVPGWYGVRIDTCEENFAEGSREVVLPALNIPEKYLRGSGVSIAAVWALRKRLLEKGYGGLRQTVSSGFDAEKTAAFREADRVFQREYGTPLFSDIGTGSIGRPVMTTSDIVAYFSERMGKWIEIHKTGRTEIPTARLREQ